MYLNYSHYRFCKEHKILLLVENFQNLLSQDLPVSGLIVFPTDNNYYNLSVIEIASGTEAVCLHMKPVVTVSYNVAYVRLVIIYF